MSRTVQIHKQLSLHQISPRWASVLGREPKVAKIHFKVRGMTIDISQMKTCVVGEAHNWDATYEGCVSSLSIYVHQYRMETILCPIC